MLFSFWHHSPLVNRIVQPPPSVVAQRPPPPPPPFPPSVQPSVKEGNLELLQVVVEELRGQPGVEGEEGGEVAL